MSRPIRAVTVAREYGSGGARVAARLAESLGWRLLDRDLIDRVARSAGLDPGVAARLDEHVDPWFARLARSLWRGGFEAVASPADSEVLDAERLARLTRPVIEEAVAIGECVIVGRGGQCILSGRPDVFHVFVYASRTERKRRLRVRLAPGADLDAAIDETDRERSAYVRRYHGREWIDRALYHLMLDSGPGEEAAVAAILGALRALAGSA